MHAYILGLAGRHITKKLNNVAETSRIKLVDTVSASLFPKPAILRNKKFQTSQSKQEVGLLRTLQ